ncbi:hypothetical protein [Halococcus saccharolyticus]|uniref:Cell surface glycoprotein n=1 Tax=Halococcus saccharolyticus DSM 5350 TaxID=1227455 RepID=M0MCC8_9EURY|nr:hypothetical protein [Halococcus saccharolyticus]EMA43422.1 hypothetical protein C449_15647 [Halococcus saccharolyticus DSM 5350]
MDRRKYLSTAALAAVGLAGCSGDSGGNNSSNGSGGSNATEAATDTEAATATEAETKMPTTAGNVETQVATEAETATGEETTMANDETEAMTTSGDEPTTAGPQTTENAANGSTNATGNASAASSGGGFSETFSGSGTSTEEGLQLSPGPITAEFSHSGESNFIVTLVTLEGESFQDVSLTNLIGQVEGSQAALVNAPGEHNLNVDADGDWEITLEQPGSPQPESLPIDASGEGPSYIGPFEFSGPATFQGAHNGDGNFIVETVPLDSSAVGSLVFNEIGQFEGETTGRVSGMAYLNINANGEWSLSTG